MLDNPELGKIILDKMGQAPFKNKTYLKIFERCLEVAKRPLYQPVEIIKDLEDEERSLLSYLLAQEIPGDDPVQIMNIYLESINRCYRQERRKNLLQEISKHENMENGLPDHDLLREYMLLQRIEDAEIAGDQGKIDQLLEEYRQFESNIWKYLERLMASEGRAETDGVMELIERGKSVVS